MNQFEIVGILNSLGIKHANHPNSKGWLDIICPDHFDSSFGNCAINITSGKYHCYRCGSKGHVDTLYKKAFNRDIHQSNNYIQPEVKEEVKVNRYITENNYNFTHTKLNPNKYTYTISRGFTNEFVDAFGIRHCLSDIYDDYLVIPIQDKIKEINEVEFRKLKEYETLQKYFNCDYSFDRLKRQFKKHVKDNNIKLDSEYKIHFNDEVLSDDTLQYLLDKKVKYLSGSKIKETIFNIDNLNRDETLYISEGLGSIPKLWSHVSKNCSCTFGSEISQDQIDYLKQFKQVIIIPDNDNAGSKMCFKLHNNLKNLLILSIDQEDTDKDYVTAILNTSPISSNEYQFNHLDTIFTNK